MKILQEVTQWDDPIPNHIYFTTDSRDRILAYVRQGTDTVTVFSKPLGFSASRRKFIEVDNSWGWQPEIANQAKTWRVAGSNGNSYTVEETANGLTCTCPGFRFRGTCKHIEEVNTDNKELIT